MTAYSDPFLPPHLLHYISTLTSSLPLVLFSIHPRTVSSYQSRLYGLIFSLPAFLLTPFSCTSSFTCKWISFFPPTYLLTSDLRLHLVMEAELMNRFTGHRGAPEAFSHASILFDSRSSEMCVLIK